MHACTAWADPSHPTLPRRYKKQRDICEEAGVCDMGGFTRILHSGEPDDLMDEIPTVVVDPLPAGALGNSSYVVLNRPCESRAWACFYDGRLSGRVAGIRGEG